MHALIQLGWNRNEHAGCLPIHCAVVSGAALTTLTQSARLNGQDPYAYPKDLLTRLPTQKASALTELLPHN